LEVIHMTTTMDTIQEWAALTNNAGALGQALDLSPCETLEAFFPAIVGDDDTMGALSAMLGPVIESVGPLVSVGHVTPDEAEEFIHNVFHLLQIAAALGHMLGIASVMDAPGIDLDSIAWDSLSDTFGESAQESD
jgi:hypothetical protein